VEPSEVGVERLDLLARPGGGRFSRLNRRDLGGQSRARRRRHEEHGGQRRHGGGSHGGGLGPRCRPNVWATHGRERGHNHPERRRLPWRERRGHLPGLPGGAAEEARERLGQVLGRQHPGQLGHRGDAEPAVAQRLQHLRKAGNQARRREPEEGPALGEPQLAGQEGEQAGVAQRLPAAAGVEVRQGQEEVGGGGVLGREQAPEVVAQLAGVGQGGGRQVVGRQGGGVHSRIVSCDSDVACDAPGAPLGRSRRAGVATLVGRLASPPAGSQGRGEGVPAAACRSGRIRAGLASRVHGETNGCRLLRRDTALHRGAVSTDLRCGPARRVRRLRYPRRPVR